MFLPRMLFLPLPPLQNLAAGAKAVLNIPPGPTYQGLQLFCADAAGVAATLADILAGIEFVRLTVNGKEKWNMTAAELVMLAEFRNSGGIANGCLPLYFNALHMEIEAQGADGRLEGGHINQDGPAWGTAGLNSIQLEVKLVAGAPGAEVVNMEVLAQQTAPTELGAHVIVLRHTRSFGSAATDRIIDLPKGVGANGQNLILNAMHISDANISKIELLADRSRFLFASRAQVHQQYQYPQGRRRTPQAGWTHIDFTGFRNRQGDAIELSMRDLELALTFSVAPADYDILLEVVDVQPSVATK